MASDFFDFFGATASALDADPDLLAVSAWNDNGQRNHVAPEASKGCFTRTSTWGGGRSRVSENGVALRDLEER